MQKLVAILIVLTSLFTTAALGCVYHDYCVVGSGPGGLQMGYFLQTAGRDYIVFERGNKSGSFFERYPRHRKLISLNKRNTGKKNVEFNFRHDWNSLMSHDDSLQVTKYSKMLFPDAEVLLQYLNDYQSKLNINVQYNTNIENIYKMTNDTAPDGHVFRMNDQRQQCYTCRTLIIATGISTPNIPNMLGIELTKGYEDASIDPQDYEGKTVLILGRGNSAFEFANSIYGATNLIHMISRSRVRLSWATHYVGDLRALNNDLLDTYQLKSLDGLLETSVSVMSLIQKGDKIVVTANPDISHPEIFDNFALREPYDVVIRALGFKFDTTIFNNTKVSVSKSHKKFPAINYNYESTDFKGLFYAGTASHSLDFRRSAGGFIHGFRYTARALHRLLEWRYERVVWPAVTVPRSQLLNTVIKRINEASGIYQMFENLGDIVVFSDDGKTATYIEEFPINLLHQLPEHTGINATSSVLAIVLEYGKNFSGPGKDVFDARRATEMPARAFDSNFLHPVMYYYKSLPTETMMRSRDKHETLPKPDKLHHIVEDFTTQWNGMITHILPFRRFLEDIWQTDLRKFYSLSCFVFVMGYDNMPEYCQEDYLSGQGFYGTQQMLETASFHSLMGLF